MDEKDRKILELADLKVALENTILRQEQEIARLRALCDRLLKEAAERAAIEAEALDRR